MIKDRRKFFSITQAGLAELGDIAPPRWIDATRISASVAKDLADRRGGMDDRPSGESRRMHRWRG